MDPRSRKTKQKTPNNHCRNETDRNLNNCEIQPTRTKWSIDFFCVNAVASERFGQTHGSPADAINKISLWLLLCGERARFVRFNFITIFYPRRAICYPSFYVRVFWLVCGWQWHTNGRPIQRDPHCILNIRMHWQLSLSTLMRSACSWLRMTSSYQRHVAWMQRKHPVIQPRERAKKTSLGIH